MDVISMKIQWIFFDLGDTLLDLAPAKNAFFEGVKSIIPEGIDIKKLMEEWEEEGIKLFLDSRDVRGWQNDSLTQLGYKSLKKVFNDSNRDVSDEEISQAIERIKKTYIDNCRFYDDVEPVIKELIEKGYSLGLITDSDQDVVNGTLMRYGLCDYFKVMVISSIEEVYKPHTEPFNIALKRAECEPQESLYVGDSKIDIFGAIKAGMRTAIIERTREKEVIFLDIYQDAHDIGSVLESISADAELENLYDLDVYLNDRSKIKQ